MRERNVVWWQGWRGSLTVLVVLALCGPWASWPRNVAAAVAPEGGSTSGGEAEEAWTSWTPFVRRAPLEDGSVRAEVFNAPVFREDADGAWGWSDPGVVATGDAAWPLAAPGLAVPVRFGSSGDALLELGEESATVRIGAPDLVIGTPTLSADGWVVYEDVAPDTDLRYRVTVGGVKEEIVLRSAEAPTTFDFEVQDGGGVLGRAFELPGGGVAFEGSVHEVVGLGLGSPVAYEAWDEGAGPVLPGRDASLSVAPNPEGFEVSVSVDAAWVAGRAFPVVLDPTVEFTKGSGLAFDGFTFYSGSGCGGCPALSWYQYGPDIRAGAYVDDDFSNQRIRSALDFDVSEIPAASEIHEATVELFADDCVAVDEDVHWYCDDGDHPLSLYALTGAWDSSSTWTDLDGLFPTSALDSVTLAAFGPSDPGQWATFDITDAVRGWADGTAAYHGLGLRHGREDDDTAGAPAFHSAERVGGNYPRMEVVYTPDLPAMSSWTHPETEAWYHTDNEHVQFDWTYQHDTFDVTGVCWVLTGEPDTALTPSNADNCEYQGDQFETWDGGLGVQYAPGAGEWWFHVRHQFDTGAWGATGRYRVGLSDAAPHSPEVTSSTHPDDDAWSTDPDPGFAWELPLTDTPNAYSYVLDADPGTTPDESGEESIKTGLNTTKVYDDVADGEWWFHVRARSLPDGLWGPTGHRRVRIDTTPPTAPEIGSPSHVDPDAWTVVDDATFTWTVQDATSGVDALSWSLNSSPVDLPDTTPEDPTGTQTQASFADLGDGEWWFHLRARDRAGNWGPAAHRRVRIDDTKPAPPFVWSPTHPDPNRWYPDRDTDLAWSATDTAPIVAYSWQVASTYSPTVDTEADGDASDTTLHEPGLADGDWWLFLRTQNASGLWSDVAEFRVQVDATGPAVPTVTSPSHPNPDAWYSNDAPQFVIDADDISDVDAYSYLFEPYPQDLAEIPECPVDDTPDDFDGQVTVPDTPDGRWRFRARARNGAGLWSTDASCGDRVVQIDTGKPALPGPLTSPTHPDPDTWYASDDPRFEWPETTDPTSTIVGYSYTLDKISTTWPDNDPDNVNQNPYTGAVSKTFPNHPDGPWWFHVRAIDAAGNASDPLHLQVRFDATPPDPPDIASTTGHTPNTWSTNDDPGFTWNASDAAPITDYDWTLARNDPDADPGTDRRGLVTTTTYTNRTNATWTFAVRARNAAGRWSTPARYTINIDDTPPAPPAITSTTHPDPNGWFTNNDPALSWTATDTAPITGYDYGLFTDPADDPGTTSRGTGTTASYSNRADGIHYLRVRARNAAGLWGELASYRVNIVPPCVANGSTTVDQPSGIVFGGDRYTLIGSVPAGASSVAVYRDAGNGNHGSSDPLVSEAALATGATTYEVEVDLELGANCYFVRARDSSGSFLGGSTAARVIFGSDPAGEGSDGDDGTGSEAGQETYVVVKVARAFADVDPGLLLPLASRTERVDPATDDANLRRWWFVWVTTSQEAEALALYDADPRLVHVRRRGDIRGDTVPNDPRYDFAGSDQRQYLNDIYGLEAAWSDTGNGAGANRIAIIDAGVKLRNSNGLVTVHPDLDDAQVGDEFDCVTNPETCAPTDDPHEPRATHGVNMTSMAAAETDNGAHIAGVGFDAEFVSVRIMQPTRVERDNNGEVVRVEGTFGRCRSVDGTCRAAMGIRVASDRALVDGVGIGNLSFRISGPRFTDVQENLNYGGRRGLVFVKSAGNDGVEAHLNHGVLSIGGTPQSNPFGERWTGRSSASNFGSDVDLAAVVTDVWENTFEPTYGVDFGYVSEQDATVGTSGAAAQVSGAVALLTADGHRPIRAAHRVESAARPFTADLDLGAGLLHVRDAVRNDVVRLWGVNRYETAVEVSRELYPGSPTAAPGSLWLPRAVVLARGDDTLRFDLSTGVGFPDALASSGLAAVIDAPVLLVDDTETDKWFGLDSPVRAEIGRLVGCRPSAAEGLDIYIVGGEDAIDGGVEDALTDDCFDAADITRIGGATRWDTSAQVAREAVNAASGDLDLGIASGENFPDATVMASWASATENPLLLVPAFLDTSGRLPAATEDFLTDHVGAFDAVHVAGGPSAVSDPVVARIRQLLGGIPTPQRHFGATRYETAIAVAEALFPGTDGAILATGTKWHDAVTGGTLAGAWGDGALGYRTLGWPMLLTPGPSQGDADPELHTAVKDYLSSNTVRHGYVVGGHAVVSQRAMTQMENRIN